MVERFIIPSVDVYYSWLGVYRPAPGGGPQISLLVQAQGVRPDEAGVILNQDPGLPGLSCPPHSHSVPCHFLDKYFQLTPTKRELNYYRHIKVSSVVHGESVRLACFPADLLHRIADVLLVIQSLRFYSEELQAGQRRKVEEPGALTGRRNRQSIDIVVGYSEDKERG